MIKKFYSEKHVFEGLSNEMQMEISGEMFEQGWEMTVQYEFEKGIKQATRKDKRLINQHTRRFEMMEEIMKGPSEEELEDMKCEAKFRDSMAEEAGREYFPDQCPECNHIIANNGWCSMACPVCFQRTTNH